MKDKKIILENLCHVENQLEHLLLALQTRLLFSCLIIINIDWPNYTCAKAVISFVCIHSIIWQGSNFRDYCLCVCVCVYIYIYIYYCKRCLSSWKTFAVSDNQNTQWLNKMRPFNRSFCQVNKMLMQTNKWLCVKEIMKQCIIFVTSFQLISMFISF